MFSTSGYVGAKHFQIIGLIFFDISSASGYMGATYFQEFGPRLFDMSSAGGYIGAKYVQEFGPRCLTCPLSLRGGRALPEGYPFTKQIRHTHMSKNAPPLRETSWSRSPQILKDSQMVKYKEHCCCCQLPMA